jgi:hypothetical protein
LAGALAFASSAAGLGTGALLPALQAIDPANTVNIIAIHRTEAFDIIPPGEWLAISYAY